MNNRRRNDYRGELRNCVLEFPDGKVIITKRSLRVYEDGELINSSDKLPREVSREPSRILELIEGRIILAMNIARNLYLRGKPAEVRIRYNLSMRELKEAGL